VFRSQISIALTLAALVVAGGLVSTYILGTVEYLDGGTTRLIARLQEMALLALVIERAVEVYLKVADQNGPDRNKPIGEVDAATPSAAKTATFAALTIGVLVALLGVRLLDSFVKFEGDWLPMTLWSGIDVLFSGALLAGGAVFIHEIVETLVGGVRKVNTMISPGGPDNAGGPVGEASATKNEAPKLLEQKQPEAAVQQSAG